MLPNQVQFSERMGTTEISNVLKCANGKAKGRDYVSVGGDADIGPSKSSEKGLLQLETINCKK